MKIYLVAALAAAALSSAAHAQAADTGSANPPVKNSTAHTTAAAAKGANSFTQAQARGRIAKAGYTNVTGLAKNRNGVWQGKAMKDGQTVNVALDYKGNVTVH